MNKSVYKSEEGRYIVESIYSNILKEYSLASFEEIFVDINGEKTHVIRFGERGNPPLVMIHGSTSNSASWLGNIPEFIDKFCIYCIDIPGETGLSDPVRKLLSSEEPFLWLVSVLDHLEIKQASFITMSLGSWYALNLAIRRPEKVLKLSMITTPGIVPARISFVFKAVFLMMLGKSGQRILNKKIYHKTEVPESVLDFQAVVSKHFIPMTEMIPQFTDEQLSKITAEIQYFGGDHDILLNSVKTGARLKSVLPEAEINILEDTGHVIINQFSVIKDFLI